MENVKNTVKESTHVSSKRKTNRLGSGWTIFVILGASVFIGPIIYLFFVLYFIDTTYSIFLVLAVLGILFYIWVLHSLLRDRNKRAPVVRIKGKEHSFWGVLIVVSFCFLVAYYLICGATILYDQLAHSELSYRIFSAVCSSKLFWWITAIGMNIHILAWVEREMEIKHAFANNHQSKENLKDK